MRIEVHHVRAKIARTRDAQYGVHVGAVQIDQPAAVMDPLGDLADLAIEQSQRVRVRHHEHCQLVVQLGAQVVQVDQTAVGALDGDRLKAGHPRTGRIGPVRRVGGQDLGSPFAPRAELGGGHHQGGQLAMSSGGRLQRYCGQARNLAQHLLQFEQQLQQALQHVFRLVGMQVGEAGQRRQPFVPLGVVLHGTGP